MITKDIFESFLKCETKGYLTYLGVVDSQGEFTDWQQSLTESYNQKCSTHLISKYCEDEYRIGTSFPRDFNEKNIRLLIDCVVRGRKITSRIHAVERLMPSRKKRTISYVPTTFVPYEKFTKHHKLLLSFDSIAIYSVSGVLPMFGMIILGSQFRTVKLKLEELLKETHTIIQNISTLQFTKKPPEPVLNRHCAQCKFQFYCRKKAVERDDLSLLSSMNEKERRKLNIKGIFTVTQLSYTFRPRKHSKRAKPKTMKYFQSLKALAIREKKIYVVGKPELNIKGTPVYLDVEGIPEQNFYYLIGLRVKSDTSFFHHSFWADDISQERQIWRDCLKILASIDNPQLIYYGSYETKFLKQMVKRYEVNNDKTKTIDQLIATAQNILGVIYAQIYFPTYSNTLKDIGSLLGFTWSEKHASGQNSLLWRYEWAVTNNTEMKEKLITYNAEDCEAVERVANAVIRLILRKDDFGRKLDGTEIIHTDTLKGRYPYSWGKIEFSLPELNYINKCAYWDYQRDKIYIRSNPILKRVARRKSRKCKTNLRINKTIQASLVSQCPKCGATKIHYNGRHSRPLYDIRFSRSGVKRWIEKYLIKHYKCLHCGKTFASDVKGETRHLYGPQLLYYVIYHNIELNVPQIAIAKNVNKLFGYDLSQPAINSLKNRASALYLETYEAIKQKLLDGKLIHVDETKISMKGQTAYVCVLTSLEEVIYFYSETREAEIFKTILSGFRGVLVSDFYAAYDSIECPKQKCLIHLMRDLNNDLLKEPFNEEIKLLAHDFASVLTPIIKTIDRFGLKKYFLRKHKREVNRFYKNLLQRGYKTEIGMKYQKRFKKNQAKLFTFLDYNGVPWNNNNAECAIRALAKLRKIIGGTSNERGIKDYLILLSICETCKYKGVSFLDFLRSGKKDIDEFSRVGSLNRNRTN